jgi:Na+/melibiose symporter-like transporter
MPPKREKHERNTLKEMFSALSHRSFLAVLASNFFSAAATGVAFSMSLYFYNFFWVLTRDQIALFGFVNFASALVAVPLARLFSRSNKRRSIILLFLVGLVISVAPMTLRLIGAFPENGAPMLFPLLTSFSFFGLALMIAASMIGYSMIADVVEDNQLKSGLRSEGLFFASNSFVLKAVSGVGVFMSGVILAVVHFPQGASAQPASRIDPEIVRNLALVYLPVILILYVIAALCLTGYRITREKHEENLRTLRGA